MMPSSELPPEIKRWSWAAWLFNWVWALARGLYGWAAIIFGLYFLAGLLWLTIIPPILLSLAGLVMCFVLGARGNEWDWKARHFRNAREFRQSHRRWENTMLIIGYGLLGLFLLAIVAGTYMAASSK